ncbi:MAG: phosphatase PAP2-related protein [Elusimicrobiota bacterium]
MRRKYLRPTETALALGAFCLAILVNLNASIYTAKVGAQAPYLHSDLLLNLLPRIDLFFLFVWGFFGFIVFALTAGLTSEKRRIAYILWMYALLIMLRSLFIILTPMSLPPEAVPRQGSGFFDLIGCHLTSGYDLFFSGHAAFPFLGYLLYKNHYVKLVFMAFSLTMALGILLCKYHYSIDILGAYFITYATVKAHQGHIEPAYKRFLDRLDSSGWIQ